MPGMRRSRPTSGWTQGQSRERAAAHHATPNARSGASSPTGASTTARRCRCTTPTRTATRWSSRSTPSIPLRNATPTSPAHRSKPIRSASSWTPRSGWRPFARGHCSTTSGSGRRTGLPDPGCGQCAAQTGRGSDQNWLAVGIDFIIVIVGVFIGIQCHPHGRAVSGGCLAGSADRRDSPSVVGHLRLLGSPNHSRIGGPNSAMLCSVHDACRGEPWHRSICIPRPSSNSSLAC